jgi:hypothetical protein
MLGKSPCDHRTQPIIALQRGRVQLLPQLPQPDSVVQQFLQDRHGDVVPKQVDPAELGAVAQGRQNGSELGVSDLTVLQIQGLQGFCDFL